jgi:hypothetical protein
MGGGRGAEESSHQVESCTKRKTASGALNASRQDEIICGKVHAYCDADAAEAVSASP